MCRATLGGPGLQGERSLHHRAHRMIGVGAVPGKRHFRQLLMNEATKTRRDV